MKKTIKAICIVVISVFSILGCSRKKDRFISRGFHSVTTEFNILYNGYIALEQGVQSLNDAYFDDYWEVLPVERMKVTETLMLPGQKSKEDGGFSKAEEKAVAAIQKHSMNIGGKEKNPQMDEAYLLLGKARYYDQRFVPALEAFNYILYKYPSSDKVNQVKIWKEKTNLRLDNSELALENLKRFLKYENLEGQDLADATSTLAQAYLNVKILDTAITQLEIAANATKSNDERGRYHFIQGQLYNKLGYKDSANIAFDKVIKLNRRTPRIYMISAHLQKINNFNHETVDTLKVKKLFKKLETNRENRPFLDKIYHQIGAYYLADHSDSLAIAYFNKSIKAQSTDNFLKARNYETIGDIKFDATIYDQAGAYYDSTMRFLDNSSKHFRLIKRKRDNLEDVINYEEVAKVDDSILRLVNLPEKEKLHYFESYVETLKAKAKKEEKERRKAALISNALAFGSGMNQQQNQIVPKEKSATFYFYNSTTVSYGENEFFKIWGDRALEDDWRWSEGGSSNASQISNATSTNAISETASNKERFDPQFYISKIPSEKKEIDSIYKERNYAYYQLGLIYKERFKEYALARNKFENLLKSNPEERLILPSKYNLYKIYLLTEKNGEASQLKEDILTNYPDSRYAFILKNPDLVAARDENSPERLYEILYEQYEKQEYAKVIKKCEIYAINFNGEPIVPKFELLKASAIARLHGYEAYKKALTELSDNYESTPEGIKARVIKTITLPKIENSEFIKDSLPRDYKVVFSFKDSLLTEAVGFKKALDTTVLKRINKYYDLNSSVDVYNPNITFVVLHGFKKTQVAKTFDELIIEEDSIKIKAPYFVVSSENYKIIQIHKKLEAYINNNTN